MASTTPPTGKTTVKVLVAADVAGHHDSLFTAALKAHQGKAGPFAMLLCVGKFFAENDDGDELTNYIEGSKQVPLPTYFIHGSEISRRTINPLERVSPDGGELCPNLTYLGSSGKRVIEGLSVCFLAGNYDENIYSNSTPSSLTKGRYLEESVEELLIEGNAYRRDVGVDILITSDWGQGFDNLLDPTLRPQSFVPGEEEIVQEDGGRIPLSPAVGRIGKELSPRYHFAPGCKKAFILPPYCNNIGVTRFYGIEPPNTSSGKVKVKAFGITSIVSSEENASLRNTATANPYTSNRFVPTKHLTVPSRAADSTPPTSSSSSQMPLEPPASTGTMDEMHTQMPSGDWKCGYCDNMNRARYKQTERCNMKYCMAPRYLGPNETGGSLSAAAAKVLQLQLAEAAEARKAQEVLEKKASQSLQHGDEEAADGSKKKKRESLYADQGGGLSNPKKNRYKKGGRPGDPSGPSHSRVKW